MWSIRGGMLGGWLRRCLLLLSCGVFTAGRMPLAGPNVRWPRPPQRTPLRMRRVLTRNGPPLVSGRRCRPVLLLSSTS